MYARVLLHVELRHVLGDLELDPVVIGALPSTWKALDEVLEGGMVEAEEGRPVGDGRHAAGTPGIEQV